MKQRCIELWRRIAWCLALLLCTLLVAASDEQCAEVTGSELLPRDGIVLFGEYHGTREPAQLFQDLVCARLKSDPGDVLLVAMELPARFNPMWQGDDQLSLAEQLEQLREDPYWEKMGDGRRSASSLALLNWLLEQRAAQPLRLNLLAFETPSIDLKGAEMIDAQLRRQPVDQTWIFTGNGHARKTPVLGKQTVTLAGSLLSLGHAVLSLDIRIGSGEAWFCSPTCGPVQLPDRADGSMRRIEMNQGFPDLRFDGWYYIPKLSISEPAQAPAR